jgi:hypothetical protein
MRQVLQDFLDNPTSANLLAAMTDETGTGSAGICTSPTLVTPVLGTVTSGNISACTSHKHGYGDSNSWDANIRNAYQLHRIAADNRRNRRSSSRKWWHWGISNGSIIEWSWGGEYHQPRHGLYFNSSRQCIDSCRWRTGPAEDSYLCCRSGWWRHWYSDSYQPWQRNHNHFQCCWRFGNASVCWH